MIREEMLARLIAQEAAQGGDLVTLRAIIEEASELGSTRALAGIGLDGPGAEADIHDLRELLAAWRDAKASVLRAVIDWSMRLALAGLMVLILWRAGGRGGLVDLLR